MKKLLLILLCTTCCLTLFAQTDTIFTKKGKTIICTITFVTQTTLYYKIKGNDIDEMDLTKVSRFTQQPTKEKQQTVTQQQNPLLTDNTKTAHDSTLISNELEYMKTCFRNCHTEYKQGALTTFLGIGVSAAGIVLATDPKQSSAALGVTALGGLLTIIGSAVIIDSHKWIGRAGLGITGNGLGVKYIFK